MKIVGFKIYGLILLGAVFALSSISVGCQTKTSENSAASNAPTATLPTVNTTPNRDAKTVDFDFTDFTGKSRKFSEFRGKIILLDFWATWCAPCLADIPKLKAIYEKHKSEGFEIVGMNVETIGDEADAPDAKTARENAARAKQIVTTRGVNWTIATSETAVPVATKIFGVESLPTKILIDKDGKVIAEIGEKDDLSGIVEKLLAASKQYEQRIVRN